MSTFASIPDTIAALQAGRMIVLVDDESRENEGDLVVPAQFVTSENVNFMLKEARGVRYGTFVSPGQTLTITADAVEIGPTRSDFKIKGTVNGNTAIQARLELSHVNLADTDASFAANDKIMLAAQQERWQTLTLTQRNGTLPTGI